MIDFIIPQRPDVTKALVAGQYKAKGTVWDYAIAATNRIDKNYNRQTGMVTYTPAAGGRHPFNIITEEIYE